MGLDMYLDKHTFIPSEDRKKKGMFKNAKEIVQEGIYWRKSNSIHHWFVNNVQDGKDDCGKYDVSIEQLTDLLNVVNKVLAGKTNEEIVASGKELLPSCSGFFFGSTDYDDYYIDDLKYTQKELNKIIEEHKKDSEAKKWTWFCYHSSW